MKQILVDIRNENDYFKKEFRNQDMVTLYDLINKFDEIIYEKNQLQDKVLKLENPDIENLFEIEEQYDRSNGN